MNQTSGTSTNFGIAGASIATTFTIFSRPQGIGPKILEWIAKERGTDRCPRLPGDWEDFIGGTCEVLPQRLQKRKEAVQFQLRIMRDRDDDISEGLLGENWFLLRERKEEKPPIWLERRIILIGVGEEDREHPPETIRRLANAIVGRIIYECIYKSLPGFGENPSQHQHPPEKKDSRYPLRIPSGFVPSFVRRAVHEGIVRKTMNDRHSLRPPLRRNVSKSSQY